MPLSTLRALSPRKELATCGPILFATRSDVSAYCSARQQVARWASRPDFEIVTRPSLAASSLFFGVSGAIAWSDARDIAEELEETEFGAHPNQSPESFREQLEDGELSQTESRILSAAAIGSGIGSIISLVLAARNAARPRSAMAPPVVLPTVGGAAVLWETRW